MPLPNTRMRVHHVYGSDDKAPFVNVCHYVLDTEAPITTLTLASQMASVLSGTFTPLYEAVLCEESRYIGCAVHIVQGGVSQSGSTQPDVSAGTVDGDTLPDYAAWIIRKQADVGGGAGRGRWFIGCVPEAFTDTSNLLTVVREGECLDLAEAFLANRTTIGGPTWVPAHYSQKDTTMLPIIGVRVISALATQRRRRFRNPLA